MATAFMRLRLAPAALLAAMIGDSVGWGCLTAFFKGDPWHRSVLASHTGRLQDGRARSRGRACRCALAIFATMATSRFPNKSGPNKAGHTAAILSRPMGIFVFLGSRSYALYVLHYPVLRWQAAYGVSGYTVLLSIAVMIVATPFLERLVNRLVRIALSTCSSHTKGHPAGIQPRILTSSSIRPVGKGHSAVGRAGPWVWRWRAELTRGPRLGRRPRLPSAQRKS